MNPKQWRVRRVMSDWQMPDFLNRIELDVDYFVAKLVEMGAEAIEFTAKSAFGSCLYQTEVGKMNPGLADKPDLFGAICKNAKAHGLETIAYVNVLLDDALGREKPEWLQQDSAGQALSFENYPIFCMNSPYRENIIALVEEIISRFDIDGIMLDIQYWHPHGCFCQSCKDRFRQATGYALEPATFDARQWLDFGKFQRQVRRELLLQIKESGDRVRSGLLWTWNGSGNFSNDPQLDAHLSFTGTEAHPPAYDFCSAKARWMRACDRSFEMWMPESIGSWGHHTVTTLQTLKGMAALALANGGAVTPNHVAPPCGDYAGKVFSPVYDLIKGLLAWIRERESLCQNKSTVKECAILHSVSGVHHANAHRIMRNTVGKSEQIFADKMQGVSNSIACSALLDQTQMIFDFIPGEQKLDRLEQYRVILLPNVGYMSRETEAAIRRFIHRGGKVLATYNTSLLDESGNERDNFGLADVFGVNFDRYSEFSIVYLDQFTGSYATGLPAMPLLIKDVGYQQNATHKAIYCTPQPDAIVYSRITEPILESDWAKGYHIYHDHAPPGRCTEFPGIVFHRYGAGACVYLPVPILQAYEYQPNPWYRRLITESLKLLGSPSKIKIDGPSWLRIVATEDESGWYIHLIRIQQETGTMFLEEWHDSSPITCTCRPPWETADVVDGVSGQNIPWQRDGKSVRWTIDGVDCHTIVHIKRSQT
ncbi:beta-galactosidase trimerization domain-containing protein [candidate division KSB1 bacterium]|nr:beta-galactosidase trimerization domain-containing protein [candidate division KSB1 bacterium]